METELRSVNHSSTRSSGRALLVECVAQNKVLSLLRCADLPVCTVVLIPIAAAAESESWAEICKHFFQN